MAVPGGEMERRIVERQPPDKEWRWSGHVSGHTEHYWHDKAWPGRDPETVIKDMNRDLGRWEDDDYLIREG
jgi:hypothetical protein